MSKHKLQHFADMANYPNVIEPSFGEVFHTDFRTKGCWNNIFGNNHPIVLELGCGKGEYTVALARQYPDKNFIGIDIKGARMWVGATNALHQHLQNVVFLRTRIEFIRSCFAAGEVSEIWITFPDPQPQQSRANKRLTSARFLNAYREILRSDGFIHLKTDSQNLFEYTRNVAKFNGLPIASCTDDLYRSDIIGDIFSAQTHYEQLFIAKGFTIKYLKFSIPAKNNLIEPSTAHKPANDHNKDIHAPEEPFAK
ncbi:MAG: tRNA (guanosine(46)-N7)-methyltransferase TrmB [Bacteroidales bacterium]|jgi:tRNA (guanine-N7-)-methyltransferase|nr:tRNA (guanosine(46)-N7)-methyltransferase TrmB [Bacteroidales bacterium]